MHKSSDNEIGVCGFKEERWSWRCESRKVHESASNTSQDVWQTVKGGVHLQWGKWKRGNTLNICEIGE